MRKLLCLAVLPWVVMAAVPRLVNSNDPRVRPCADNGESGSGVSAPWFNQRVAPIDVYGRLDTCGGSTYDYQVNGPGYHGCYHDPRYGTHVAWMWSAEPGSPWNDRNMRYNYHNRESDFWDFNIGPDFMQWGINAFTNRSGYGHLDVDPVTGCEVISGHLGQSDQQYPAVSRDLTPGAGVFETESLPSPPAFLWACVGVTPSQKVHIAMIDYPARASLFYVNITWPDWSTPVDLPPPGPEPGATSQNLATSHLSNKVCVAWTEMGTGILPYRAYFKTSEDDGTTWSDSLQLTPPPAFSPVPGESLGPCFMQHSVFPFYDSHDNLHIAATITCAATESTLYYFPVEIWNWSQVHGWAKVARADADSLLGGTPTASIGATRPQLGCGPGGELVCMWEQFDPVNVETETGLLRADIWGAASLDGGATWLPAVRITDPDETSKRFPCVSPNFKGDSVVVAYMVDLVSGGVAQNEGPSTNNPIVVNTIPYTVFTGIAEGPRTELPPRFELTVAPTLVRNATKLTYDLPRAGNVRLSIYNATGRVVRSLAAGNRAPSSYTASWNGTDDHGTRLQPGIYFATLTAGNRKLTRKLVLAP